MLFCQDIALLHSICNKQTLFFAEMLNRMDGDQVVQMTSYVRKQIVTAIGSKSENRLNVARQYLKQLSDAGLVADLSDGAYMINPKIAGFTNIARVVDSKSDIFLSIKYSTSKERQLAVSTQQIDATHETLVKGNVQV